MWKMLVIKIFYIGFMRIWYDFNRVKFNLWKGRRRYYSKDIVFLGFMKFRGVRVLFL